MSQYVLQCSCDSTDFTYLMATGKFVCNDCGEEYSEEEAGKHLASD